MPELPDVAIYVEALRDRIVGHVLNRVVLCGPFLLRSTDPPLDSAHGRNTREVRRLGKRIAIGLEGGLWLVLHLMIAGRLHWRLSGAKPVGARPGAKGLLALFEFASGSLVFSEAGSQHRASLHAVLGEDGLRALDAGGIEVLDAGREAFAAALLSANHTLKRALTDPRLFSGIGNAYSDEILHRARLSPVAMTSRLTPGEIARLHQAACAVLFEWIAKLRDECGSAFPERVTAFREGMAVHGRYGQPCPCCGSRIQRIRYASNETNYCPVCQTGRKLLADRALSRLLRQDWPRTLEELEALHRR
ncbi:MAG: DNA-formamidopyrimidine glycosylase family protein [Bryobacteraceae bacterium]|jgi:formamidopyrimidine-DNA glycosylase